MMKEFELAGVCLKSLAGLVALCPSAIPTFFPWPEILQLLGVGGCILDLPGAPPGVALSFTEDFEREWSGFQLKMKVQ